MYPASSSLTDGVDAVFVDPEAEVDMQAAIGFAVAEDTGVASQGEEYSGPQGGGFGRMFGVGVGVGVEPVGLDEGVPV